MAEAIGIALAVAPLVVSAAEHYSTAAKFIRRYRLYDSKREELTSKVEVQRAIFRKTIWRLLAYDVGLGEDEASQMITDAQHPGWSEDETEAYFVDRMADVSEEMMDLIRMINSQLAVLEFNQATISPTASLDPDEDRSRGKVHDISLPFSCNLALTRQSTTRSDGQTPGVVDIRSEDGGVLHKHTDAKGETFSHVSVRKKIRFAVSEEKLREAVENIRILTKEFCTLVKQTAPPQGRTAIARPSSSTRGRVARYAAVKTAASDLYQALGLACTKHTAHQAHLSLKPTYGNASQIRFTIAFRQTIPATEGRKPCSETSPPMWLTVESQVNGTIQATDRSNLLDEVKSTMKRPADTAPFSDSATKSKKLTKKSVKFHLATGATPEVPLQLVPGAPLDSIAPLVQNLCTHSNFCNQLQNFLGQPLSGSQTCIGYLECSGESKHLVYMKSKGQSILPATPRSILRPLREVYSHAKQENNHGAVIPLQQRIRLAKELATAVLQFHATPWLVNSICSEDVLLPGTNELTPTTERALHEPYVDVSIKGPHGPLPRHTTLPSRTLIRNRLLFSLGVMLLELAYQAPLHSLQRPTDVDAHMPPNTDYHIADRVRHEAASILGPRYAEVIRKCIQCDFGRGDDLGETRLQEGFHQDVVCELEELEERFRSFGLAI